MKILSHVRFVSPRVIDTPCLVTPSPFVFFERALLLLRRADVLDFEASPDQRGRDWSTKWHLEKTIFGLSATSPPLLCLISMGTE